VAYAGNGDFYGANVVGGKVAEADAEVGFLLEGGADLQMSGYSGALAGGLGELLVLIGGEVEADGLAGGVEELAVGIVEIGGEFDGALVGAIGLGLKGEGSGECGVVDEEAAEGAFEGLVWVQGVAGCDGVFGGGGVGEDADLEEDVLRRGSTAGHGGKGVGRG